MYCGFFFSPQRKRCIVYTRETLISVLLDLNISNSRKLALLWISLNFIQHHFFFYYSKSFSFLWKNGKTQINTKKKTAFRPSIQQRVLGIEAINKYLLIECQELAPWPLGKLLKLSYSICKKKGWLAGFLGYLFPYVMDLCDISDLSGTWWKVLNKSYLYYYLWGRNYLKFAVFKYLTALCHQKERKGFICSVWHVFIWRGGSMHEGNCIYL